MSKADSILKKLFDTYSEEEVFRLDETRDALAEFVCDIFPGEQKSEKAEKALDHVVDIYIRERENAFVIGVRAGIKLGEEIFGKEK